MLRRAVKAVFHWTVALLVLFEEWGWEPLGRAIAKLAQLPAVASLERWIAGLSPQASLAAFALPFFALLPVKLFAIWLIAHGHELHGIAFVIAAKLAGTAITARLFTLTHPSLMRMAWFAAAYERWSAWKEAIVTRVRASAAWRAIYAAKAAARAMFLRIKSNFT